MGTSLLADFSAEEIDKARAKVEAVETGRSDKFSGSSVSRFRAQTAGAVSLIDKMLRLIDRTRDRGNREPRLAKENLELIRITLERDYNTPTQQTKKSAYAKYLVDAKASMGSRRVNQRRRHWTSLARQSSLFRTRPSASTQNGITAWLRERAVGQRTNATRFVLRSTTATRRTVPGRMGFARWTTPMQTSR
jgi:hypothetical protein